MPPCTRQDPQKVVRRSRPISRTPTRQFGKCIHVYRKPMTDPQVILPREINCFEQPPANQLFLWVLGPVQHSHALRERSPEVGSTFSCLAHPTSSSFRLTQAAVRASCRARVPCVGVCVCYMMFAFHKEHN